MPIKVEVPKDQNKIIVQIKALKYLLSKDIRFKDFQIHLKALLDLIDALEEEV